MKPCTEVKICFFKPTGYEDTYYFPTTNRGEAAKAAMAKYDDNQLACLNYINLRITSVDEDRLNAL